MVYIEMSSFENKQGVAQSLADEQKQTSIAEFFKQNKQMLGFGSKTRAIVTAVKEGVDNSLDAAEEAGILPDIRVDIEKKEQYYTVTIEDNGPGIPKDSMSSVFGKLLYGSRFHRRVQTRGQQGIGISAAVLYSQLTSGNPARITSKTEENEKADYIEMGIDTDNNKPVIKVEDKVEVEKDHGIKIELDMEGNMRGRKRLHNYIHQTAVVNPHATVGLHDPKESLVYDERPVDELPEDVEEIKPHPHGVELGTLIDMLEQTDSRKLKSFFTQEFTRVGSKTAEGILNGFRDHYYGRSIAWKVLSNEVSEDDYKQAIRDSVRGKGEEATDIFMKLIYEQMKDSDTVSKAELKEIVSDSAEKASEKTDKQFASTVQENVVESVWNIIKKNIEFTIDKKVEDVTVDRKSDDLIEMIVDSLSSRFRQKHPSEISKSKLEKLVKDVAEESVLEIDNSSFGDKAQDKVVTEIWDNSQSVNYDLPSISEVASDRDLAKSLLEGMRESDAMAPPTKCLSPITEDDIETGLKSRYDADFYTSCTRGAKVAEGDPFIIETGIAYGGQLDNEGQIELNRFANRVPLVYQQGACSITKRIKSIRWNNYYRSGDSLSQNSGSLPQGPMVLMVHVASTSVPFTSESKDAVADVPQMEEEVERAVREVARDLKDHLKKERTRRERKQKEDVIGGLLEDMTDKIETVVDDEIDSKVESQARILNNLFVRKTGKKTIRVTNYGGRKYKVQIKMNTENGERKRNLELNPNETQSTHIPDEIESYEVLNPEDPRVTVKT